MSLNIRELTYTRAATVNIGNYESRRIEITATIQIDKEDDEENKYASLRTWVLNKLQADIRDLKR